MSIYDRMSATAPPVTLHEDSTSYFSEPTEELDPFLFDGTHFKPFLRQAILSLVLAFLSSKFQDPGTWSTTWVAGSGVSYQWSAAREPGDLDVLVGVDWLAFRRANRDLGGLSNKELADYMNANFREHLAPLQHAWMNKYDLTMYVNVGGSNIADLKPYSAYNLTTDAWTVTPDPHPEHASSTAWDKQFAMDAQRAEQIVGSYDKALEDMHGVLNPARRLNAEIVLRTSAQQAVDLFNEIHEGRHAAFEGDGLGYADYANHRWQSGKSSGAVGALKAIKDALSEATGQEQVNLYGAPLPDARSLLIASATARRWNR